MIAVFVNRIGPYHRSRLEHAAKVIPDLHAWEWSGRDSTYAWDLVETGEMLSRHVLVPDQDAEQLPAARLYRVLSAALEQYPVQALVINGWGFSTSRAAIHYGIKKGIPMVLMSESTAWDAPRRILPEWVKRQLVAQFGAALVGGGPQRDYLLQLGMAENRIFTGYNAVDNDYFSQSAERGRSGNITGGRPCFLASGRFIEKKNFIRLIEAYAKYLKTAPDTAWDLVLLGDGPLRTEIEAAITRRQLQDRVHLPGFIQYDQLPEYYGGASAFILPSTTEQWGLVVNEAMAGGLPVLVSRRCGCSRDLVEPGENGLLFDPESTSEIADAMLHVSTLDEETRQLWGRKSRAIIRRFHPREFAGGLGEAMACALRQPPVTQHYRRWIANLATRCQS